MKILTKGLASIALLSAAFALGCGSGSGSADGGDATGAGGTGAGGTGGVTLFALTQGDSCYDIVSVATGSDDGCMIGVADSGANGLIGTALPVNYTFTTTSATVKVGTDGSLGSGAILNNMATLTRANDPTLPNDATCGWHQVDTSLLTMTADYEFDLAVTEDETMFKAACGTANTPTGGMCTSTWTWHMKVSTTKVPTTTPPCT
jgi:hypothetical protein